MSNREQRMEELLSAPLYVADPLPEQVPKDSKGNYFATDNYWYESGAYKGFQSRYIDMLEKLGCYYALDFTLGGRDAGTPAPAEMKQLVRDTLARKEDVVVFTGDMESMLLLSWDSPSMAVYGPCSNLVRLLDRLATGEGMFFWKVS